MAIEQVWKQCLELHKGNFHKALKHYKGTVTNYKSYNRTLAVYYKLKKVHNDNNRTIATNEVQQTFRGYLQNK